MEGLNQALADVTADPGASMCDTPNDFLLHKFRATLATMHLRAGVDLRTVQLWLAIGISNRQAVPEACSWKGRSGKGECDVCWSCLE